ncbi:superoxide dismutase [Mesobacillus maritimus]|uniref:superoxide dismutase n=1 Tax=Mesobacillus maritimus TaxID=1643336 RepID=UPI00384B0644
MIEQPYREILANWCEEIEDTFKTALEQLTHRIDEPVLADWENKLVSLMNEVNTEESLVDEATLYEQATSLHEEFQFLLQETEIETDLVRQDTEALKPVPLGGHRLPPLPYAYHALEPVIAEEIMRLHHSKHHQSYVDGLNKAENEMKKAREKGDFSLIKHWEREAAFHGSGHYLHTIFWNVMSPNGGGKPSGQLMNAINNTFGSFNQFKNHFTEAAKNVEAVGWAILVWAPRSQRLEILTAEKHQNLTQWDTIPLLVLDVWEHAYYLQYKNERAKYVENWWNVVNWSEVENRYNKASKLSWKSY